MLFFYLCCRWRSLWQMRSDPSYVWLYIYILMRVKQCLVNHPIIPKFTFFLDINHQNIAGWWLFYQPVVDDPRCFCLLRSHWCASAHSTMTAEAISRSFIRWKKLMFVECTWWDWNGVIEMFTCREMRWHIWHDFLCRYFHDWHFRNVPHSLPSAAGVYTTLPGVTGPE